MKDTRWKKLSAILDEADVYGRALGKVDFDMQCIAPPEGRERAGLDEAVLMQRIHSLFHSKRFFDLICSLHDDPEGLTAIQRRVVELQYREYERSKNETAAFARERSLAGAAAYGHWLEAKQKSDFSLFRHDLAATADYTRRTFDLRDKKPSTYYNGCLDDTEYGGSEAQLDAFFAALKEGVVPLLRRIQAHGKPIRDDFITRRCPVAQQEAFSRYLLELEGLRPTALVLMTTEHPFTTNFGPTDVRVTTHYYEDRFVSSIFSTLHEGGHALFMQNEPEEFYTEHLSDCMSNAMHETISRFYENYIGRSRAFIHFIYPKLREFCPSVMDGVSEQELYEGVNLVRPGLIRTEADELTYCLHIIVRYEIEKELVNGRITADQVPGEWNARYKEYLGVEVPDDARGCLQDVHWTGGFGYFPSYALGSAYGAQILHAMEKDLDVYAAAEKGDLIGVGAWLKANVFSRASLMDPDEWIRAVTGEPLDAKYFLEYLEKKFSDIYRI